MKLRFYWNSDYNNIYIVNTEHRHGFREIIFSDGYLGQSVCEWNIEEFEDVSVFELICEVTDE